MHQSLAWDLYYFAYAIGKAGVMTGLLPAVLIVIGYEVYLGRVSAALVLGQKFGGIPGRSHDADIHRSPRRDRPAERRHATTFSLLRFAVRNFHRP
jgi:hypothetical protein